jgi:Flp pilus assembly pilin Flp
MIRKTHTPSKSRQKGASLIEYALILAAVVVIGTVFFGSSDEEAGGIIGGALNTKATNLTTQINGE